MRKVKVFISSVIKSYEDRRDAAEEAIIELNRDQGFNFEVIRMEPNKNPAVNKSPQKACLDSVKECDIYLGIYPRNNYGWKESPIGISPTHEEFRQAVKDNKCRLVFVENTKEVDPRQEEFLKEVGEYVKGRFWNEFESGNVNQLKHMVYRALWNLMKANFEDCLPNYLKAILQRYERIIRPWEESDSLPTSEIVQLELREEEQKEEKKSQTEYDNERYSERLSKSRLFSDAIKENQRLLIIGDSGAGKSTSLQWVTYSYAGQISSSQKELPVPVYLELKWYKNNLLKLIVTCFGENGIVCDEETINDWIKKGRFLFILDGFDEVSRDSLNCLRDIKQLMGLSRESRFVVASRKIEHLEDFQSLGFKKAEVKQLSESQVELFVEKYLGKEEGSRLLKELEKHNLLNEAKNPLILWFMTLEFREEKSQISINKGMLFKNVIERRFLRKWESKAISAECDIQKYTDLKIEALSELAFSMIEEENSIKIEEEKTKEIIDAFLKEGRTAYKDLRDEILKQLFACHILIKTGSQISFWHKSFRDYFAALKLKEIFSKEPKKFMKRYVTEKWEDSLLFLIGIMDKPSDFVDNLIQPFWLYFLTSSYRFPFRLSLAAKCIGANNNINLATQQKVVNQLEKIVQMGKGFCGMFFPSLLDVSEAVSALGETRSDKAEDILTKIIDGRVQSRWHVPEYLRSDAVMAIQNLPTIQAQYSLLRAALWDKEETVRYYATEILGKNMAQEIESKLLQVLSSKNEKCEVRRRALYTLRGHYDISTFSYISTKKKYSDEVIDMIVRLALEEECRDLRVSACNFLGFYRGQSKEENIVDPLIHALLKNPDATIRRNAAYALGFHFSHKVRKALIQALDDKNAKVRTQAAHTLAYVGTKTQEEENEVSQKLLRLFSDTDDDVRINAIYTYGCIRRNHTDEELSQLINLLEDENITIRYLTARALGCLKARAALDALKQMIQDEEYVYPWAYAIWAVLQIEPSFSEVIKEKCWEYPYIVQLNDNDIDKRRMAVEVLRRIGTEICLPFLKEINEDYDRKRDIRGELFYAIHDIEERIKSSNV